MKESISISLRVSRGLLERLEKAGHRETRSRSSQIKHYIRQGLERDGFLSGDELDQGEKPSGLTLDSLNLRER